MDSYDAYLEHYWYNGDPGQRAKVADQEMRTRLNALDPFVGTKPCWLQHESIHEMVGRVFSKY